LARFLPDKTTLSLEAWHVDDAAAEITLHVTAAQASVPCPLCHGQTARVHSRYARTLADLPWSTYAVRLQLRVRKFFCDHPTITVVCRDRSALYAEGIRRGAPHAVQVVDRFHLVKNLREAVEAFLHSQRPALQAAAARTAQALTQVAGLGSITPMYRGRRQCSDVGQQRQDAAQQQRHAAWVTTYEAIHTLHAAGTPV